LNFSGGLEASVERFAVSAKPNCRGFSSPNWTSIYTDLQNGKVLYGSDFGGTHCYRAALPTKWCRGREAERPRASRVSILESAGRQDYFSKPYTSTRKVGEGAGR
jgi:hypothetical protein